MDYNTDVLNNNFQNVINKSNSFVNETSENVKEILGTYNSNKTSIILGLVAVIIICGFISWGLYIYISGSLFKQSRIIINDTNVPILCNRLSKISINSFNDSGNGKRRSYTFWIYINDLNKNKGLYKHVFHIGDDNDIINASPYVFLDTVENKLNVRFASIDTDTYTDKLPHIQTLSIDQKNKYMQQGIEIPYIPIQRWVHIGIVINENSNGGSIVAYVDGDLSKVITTGDISSGGTLLKMNNLNLDKKGNLVVGGTIDGINDVGFSGLISKISMYNYDLNDKDIYNDYNEGPLDGFLSKYLGSYGVRSPIYRIS